MNVKGEIKDFSLCIKSALVTNEYATAFSDFNIFWHVYIDSSPFSGHCFDHQEPRVNQLPCIEVDRVDETGCEKGLGPLKLRKYADWMNAVGQQTNGLICLPLVPEDVLRLIRVDLDCAGLTNWHSERVHRLVSELRASVDDGPCMDFDAHCSN